MFLDRWFVEAKSCSDHEQMRLRLLADSFICEAMFDQIGEGISGEFLLLGVRQLQFSRELIEFCGHQGRILTELFGRYMLGEFQRLQMISLDRASLAT